MASEITHIPYGKKIIDQFLGDQKINPHHFYLGTLFPDIRYLGSIDRDITHHGIATIQAIRAAKSDFEKGRLTHLLIDLEHRQIFENFGLYELVPKSQISTMILKYLEDEVTYPLVENWEEIRSYLRQGVLEEELAYVSEEIAKKWHNLLDEYFASPPTLESALKMASTLTLTKDQLHQAKEMVNMARENKEITRRLKQVYSKLLQDQT